MSVRIPAWMDEWLRRRAGEERSRSDVVRELIEAEMAREEATRLSEMFEAAAAEVTDDDRDDRDLVLGGFADRE